METGTRVYSDWGRWVTCNRNRCLVRDWGQGRLGTETGVSLRRLRTQRVFWYSRAHLLPPVPTPTHQHLPSDLLYLGSHITWGDGLPSRFGSDNEVPHLRGRLFVHLSTEEVTTVRFTNTTQKLTQTCVCMYERPYTCTYTCRRVFMWTPQHRPYTSLHVLTQTVKHTDPHTCRRDS